MSGPESILPKSCSSLSIVIIAEPKVPFARYRQEFPLALRPAGWHPICQFRYARASLILICKTNEIYCRFTTIILHHHFNCDEWRSPFLFGFDMHFLQTKPSHPQRPGFQQAAISLPKAVQKEI